MESREEDVDFLEEIFRENAAGAINQSVESLINQDDDQQLDEMIFGMEDLNGTGSLNLLSSAYGTNADQTFDTMPMTTELDQVTQMMNSYFDIGDYGLAITNDGDLELALDACLQVNRRYQNELRIILADLEQAESQSKSTTSSLRGLQKRLWACQRSRLLRSHGPSHPIDSRLLLRRAMSIKTLLKDLNYDFGEAVQVSPIVQSYRAMVGSYRRWSSKETSLLREGVRQTNQKVLLNLAMDKYGDDPAGINSALKELRETPPESFEMSMQNLNWDRISSHYLNDQRSPRDCQIQWTVNQHPLINNGEWTAEELEKLESLVKQFNGGAGKWTEIAEALGTNRTAYACLSMYQRKIKGGLLKGRWTTEEDACLLDLIKQYGEHNWPLIASLMPGGYRTSSQCLLRYQKTLRPDIKKGKWTEEEDTLLRLAVQMHGGAQDWYLVCRWVPGRTDVQCRERYMNILNPSLKEGPFTAEEDELLLKVVSEAGNSSSVSWASIQSLHFPGRTDSQVRRRWRSLQLSSQASAPTRESSSGKKKRGRPKSTSSASLKPAVRKQKTVLSEPKRPRGRPRKNPLPVADVELQEFLRQERKSSLRKRRPTVTLLDAELDEDSV